MALQFHETFVTYAAETARMGSTKFIYHKLHYQIFSAFLAHSKLGCEISPILLESKENGRWRIKSLTCVNDAR